MQQGKVYPCPECGFSIEYLLEHGGSRDSDWSYEVIADNEFRLEACPECGDESYIVDHA